VLLAVVLVLASLVSYFYYLRVVWYMWFRDGGDTASVPALPAGLRIALVVAVAGVLLTGMFPGRLLDLAERSAATLAQPAGGLFGLP
jgi:NADH-quinone oxidoreductase subunit N